MRNLCPFGYNMFIFISTTTMNFCGKRVITSTGDYWVVANNTEWSSVVPEPLLSTPYPRLLIKKVNHLIYYSTQ